MEITITCAGVGRWEVTTDLGHYSLFFTDREAANYADGLAVGYRAAIAKLGSCHKRIG